MQGMRKNSAHFDGLGLRAISLYKERGVVIGKLLVKEVNLLQKLLFFP